MERSQITRYEGERNRGGNHCYVSQNDSRARRRRAIRLRKRMMRILQIALILAFIVCVVTAIVSAAINVKIMAEELKERNSDYSSEFVIEEREDGFKFQSTTKKAEDVSFEILEIRAPIALAEATPNEEKVSYLTEEPTKESVKYPEVDNSNETNDVNVVEIPFEIFEEEPTEENNITCVEVVEEYKPTKLAGYEISATEPYEHYIYILSEEDMKIIAKLVWMEARGESYEGMVAVAAVVLNRYFSDDQSFYRTSILDTVTQPYQFASIWGVTDWDLSNNPDCLNAVKDACRGWDPTRAVFDEGALFFYAPNGVSGYQAEIRQNIKVMVIGNHNFHFDFEKVNG